MENFIPPVLDLFTLLVDTYKIYLRNGRLMAFLAALIISFQTMLHLINVFSIKPLISDFINKQSLLLLTTPGSPEFTNVLVGMQREINIFAGVEWIFLLLSAVTSVFFTISTTHASALIHGAENTSIKDLASKTIRSLKRPFVTCFYITLLGLGFIFLCVIVLLPFVLIFGNNFISSYSGILLSVSALVFCTYLSVVWNLSLVVSILEEKSGIEALGKASEIIKGMKLVGFILSLVLAMLSMILLHILERMMDFSKQSKAMIVFMGLLVLNSIRMMRMFEHVAYTVLYYKCKESHGEEVVELGASMEYTKIAPAALLNESFP